MIRTKQFLRTPYEWFYKIPCRNEEERRRRRLDQHVWCAVLVLLLLITLYVSWVSSRTPSTPVKTSNVNASEPNTICMNDEGSYNSIISSDSHQDNVKPVMKKVYKDTVRKGVIRGKI